MPVEFVALAAAIVGALFCVCMAGIKDRDMAAWLLLGALLPPIAVIAICVVPTGRERGER